ncbi:ABC transporter substrate-binding protein [Hansschlegelia beijingensis]|uniref:NitT/TauT family transport system substrate-binding protein n=1 Tax=Hansschlegelia beijingensis TaxID=1133344 RepID=A0A7W6CWG8_9HYPH|nr:ABC transporter substrate-binding protein [Hansschlegelia beijingensis]MBB3971649.1 NitT/TauT family transport system substrate-binding protein [Hansschlegelia beijingensis]
MAIGLTRGLCLAAALAFGWSTAASAEVSTVRLAKQFGISYLPLTVIQEEKLLEKHAKDQGLDVTTEWLRFTGGSGMNEALLSGNLDFAAGGVGPALTIWGKTRNNLKVRGVAALNAMPLYLVTTNPDVKTIKDFTSKDKIALPTVKTSIQAVTLQMAAEKAFGEGQQNKLDPLTVSMGHPDAQIAMMGGKSEINAHFGSSPFQELELKDPKAHKVLDSYDVLGGPHTFNLVWASTRFVDANPKIVTALVAALEDAMQRIKTDPKAAAELWIKAENVKMPVEDAVAIISNPQNEWTTTPKKMLAYLDYMNRAGLVSTKTDDWKELFFPNIQNAQGS